MISFFVNDGMLGIYSRNWNFISLYSKEYLVISYQMKHIQFYPSETLFTGLWVDDNDCKLKIVHTVSVCSKPISSIILKVKKVFPLLTKVIMYYSI